MDGCVHTEKLNTIYEGEVSCVKDGKDYIPTAKIMRMLVLL